MSTQSSPGASICHEAYRKPNVRTSRDRLGSAGITVCIVCPDEASAKAEAVRLSGVLRRAVHNRPWWTDKGRRVTRYTLYQGDVTTNVVVESGSAA